MEYFDNELLETAGVAELKELVLFLADKIEQVSMLYAELKHENTELRRENTELRRENMELKRENAELKSRLSQNSSNSSKSPSSDGYRKCAKITPPKNGKQGGQEGHQGNTLRQVAVPDAIKKCVPARCGCGYPFAEGDMYLSEKRQEFDLPKPKLFVTEHQIFKAQCPQCGQIHTGTSPLNAFVQYGNGVKTFVSMLNTHYKMPLNKIELLFDDLFGVPINGATIQTSNSILHERLAPTELIIKKRALSSAVLNADETGVRINKKLHWLHTLSTPLLTYLFAHTKRGSEAINDAEKGVLAEFTNWLVHDCWSSYFSLEKAKHAICNAHIIRELQGIIDNNESISATKMQNFLLAIYKQDFQERIHSKQKIITEYEKICKEWEIEEPPPQKIEGKRGKTKKTKARNLLERLSAHQEKVLAFAFNAEVPFTNNLAERDLRPVKLKQKISNCFRTLNGADVYARIESFISTCRKNNENIFNEIYNSFNGYNFLTRAK
jgi:transposase